MTIRSNVTQITMAARSFVEGAWWGCQTDEHYVVSKEKADLSM